MLVKGATGNVVTTTDQQQKALVENNSLKQVYLNVCVFFQGVVVHCLGGHGRTGTMLACYMVKHLGFTGKRAIEEIRRRRPGSVETKEQEELICKFDQLNKQRWQPYGHYTSEVAKTCGWMSIKHRFRLMYNRSRSEVVCLESPYPQKFTINWKCYIMIFYQNQLKLWNLIVRPRICRLCVLKHRIWMRCWKSNEEAL